MSREHDSHKIIRLCLTEKPGIFPQIPFFKCIQDGYLYEIYKLEILYLFPVPQIKPYILSGYTDHSHIHVIIPYYVCDGIKNDRHHMIMTMTVKPYMPVLKVRGKSFYLRLKFYAKLFSQTLSYPWNI